MSALTSLMFRRTLGAERSNGMHDRWDHEIDLHPPVDSGIAEDMDAVRAAVKALGHLIIDRCPAGREQSLALTNLRQAGMWAIGAIACGEANVPSEGGSI